MGADGISPGQRQRLERVAERFVAKFDANGNGQIDGNEHVHQHLLPLAGGDSSFAIDGTVFIAHSTSTHKADMLDGKLVTEADCSGDGAASPAELVDDYLGQHDTNQDGTTTKAELKADHAGTKRDFRQFLRSHTTQVEVTRDNWTMGNLGSP